MANPNLKVKYTNEVAPALMQKFGYKSTMQIPRLDKVVLLGRNSDYLVSEDLAVLIFLFCCLTGEKYDSIASFDIHRFYLLTLKYFGSERQYLEVLLFSELSCHRAKDTCATGGLVFLDDDRCVLIELDI